MLCYNKNRNINKKGVINMPVGPSHSSSSGGGSHGGSHGGGSHGGINFGGISFDRGERRPPRPRRPITFHWFGRPIVVSTGVQNMAVGLLVVFICLVLGTVGCFIGFSSNAKNLSKAYNSIEIMESDAVYYKQLIEKAKDSSEGDYHLEMASFEMKFFRTYTESDYKRDDGGVFEFGEYNGITYYFVCYKYSVGSGTQSGETYTQFSSSAIRGCETYYDETNTKFGKMQIAWHYDEDDCKYYSINTDYTLEKNIDYKSYKSSLSGLESGKKACLIGGCVMTVVTILVLAIMILTVKKRLKKEAEERKIEEAKNQAEIEKANAEAETARSIVRRKNRYCAYCGAKIREDAEQCDACGSRSFNTSRQK